MEMSSTSLFFIRTECPLCGTEKLQTLRSVLYTDPALLSGLVARYEGNLSKEDLEGASYTLLHCVQCDFVFQQYVPTDVLVQKLYSYRSTESINRSLSKRFFSRTRFYSNNATLAERVRIILDEGKTGPARYSAFEYGAGWGYFSLMVKAFGFDILSLEVSRERTESLQSLSIPTIASLKELYGEFDYLHSDQVFEHIANPLEVFKKITSHLNTRGVFFISVPNGNNIKKRILQNPHNYFLKDVYPLEHVNCFSTKSLVVLARRAGLKPVKAVTAIPYFLKYFSFVRIAQGIQESIRFFIGQKLGTALYFTKR